MAVVEPNANAGVEGVGATEDDPAPNVNDGVEMALAGSC